jgi:hypothetical protein
MTKYSKCRGKTQSRALKPAAPKRKAITNKIYKGN